MQTNLYSWIWMPESELFRSRSVVVELSHDEFDPDIPLQVWKVFFGKNLHLSVL